jgi:disulfide bond formation protein DsbB
MNRNGLYLANSAAMLIVSSVLMGAFIVQYGFNEEPCPLCLLQRMGMLGVIFGLSLNTWFGFRKEHFALVILAALISAIFSIRQILLHICPVPGEPTGYGTVVMGMHLYSWAVVIYGASMLGSVVFLFLFNEEKKNTKRTPLTVEKIIFYLVLLLAFANMIAAFFECHLGPCCENGPCT